MPKPFVQAGSLFVTLSNDTSDANRQLGYDLMNVGIREILSRSDFTFNRTSRTFTTGTQVQAYGPVFNADKIDHVSVTVGSVTYTPQEKRSDREWQQINYVSSTSDVPSFWHNKLSTGKIELWPIPVTNGNTITVVHTKKIRDLSATEYTTGTVTLTSGTNAITGGGSASTSFTNRHIGQYITLEGKESVISDFWFEITARNSGTSIVVKQTPSDTLTGTFRVAELVPFPDGYENIPVWYALDKFYQMRERPILAREYERMWRDGVSQLEKRDVASIKGVLTKEHPVYTSDPNYDPRSITLS